MSTTPKPTASGIDALAVDTGVVAGLLTGFIRDEVHKVGFDAVVVGLSGGVDSSLVTVLARQTLGAEHVFPVFMPYRTSDPQSAADARAVCEQAGLALDVVDISAQIDAYFAGAPEADRTRRGNKM